MKYTKSTLIRGTVILECLAILGAVPLIRHSRYVSPSTFFPGHTVWNTSSFWEDNPIALGVFLVVVLGIVIFYTRHQPIKTQVFAPIFVIGPLLLTVFGIQAFRELY